MTVFGNLKWLKQPSFGLGSNPLMSVRDRVTAVNFFSIDSEARAVTSNEVQVERLTIAILFP